MNNCPKCGNPLQPGTISCPICGTNIQQVQAQTPAANQNINNQTTNVDPIVKEQNVQAIQGSQPVVTTTTEEKITPASGNTTPTPVAKPVEAAVQTSTEVKPMSVQQGTTISSPVEIQPVTPVTNAAPVEPIQTNTSGTQPAKEQVEQISKTPMTTGIPLEQQTAQQNPKADEVTANPISVSPSSPTSIPTVAPTEAISTPTNATEVASMPSIPSSLNNNNNNLEASTLKVEAPKEETKTKSVKFGKKNLIVIVVAIVVVVAGIGLYLNMGKGKTVKPQNNNTPTEDNNIATSSSGYRFNLPSNWSIVEDGTNVILKSSDETIIVKLENISNSFEELTEEKINKYLENIGSVQNIQTISTQISGKDAYLINATINNSPVQIYYINSGSKLITGATIIYQNDDIKSSSDVLITELLGTLSYADESINAIGTLNMYSNIFNIYKGIINYKEPTIPNNEPENNPENNGGSSAVDQPTQPEIQPNENSGAESPVEENSNNEEN